MTLFFLIQNLFSGFSSLLFLKSHIDKHKRERNYNCIYCGERFTEFHMLHCHIKCLHPEITPPYDSNDSTNKCHVCDKILPSGFALYDHLQKHDSKKFLCSTCGKTCSTSTLLKVHEAIHSDVKPYTCKICGRSFRKAPTLKNHFMRHTGEKPYCCEVCHKRFRQSGEFKTHMRTHTGIRPYKCKICEKGFTTKGKLDIHFRIHTGERPFACDLCGKGFYCKISRRRHRETHRDKNHSC